jgi:hypothetical protein
MAQKFATRKFNGDSQYSWAVFRAADVKGQRGILVWGCADPIVTGLTKREADYYKQKFEKEFA